MEKVVSKILNKFLGDFVQNLDSENFDISLRKGKIELHDFKLKEDALHILGLPFTIVYGIIKNINIKIKWTKLNSSPLRISISGVHMLLVPNDPKTWEIDPEMIALSKFKTLKLKQFEAAQVKEITEAESEGGFLKRHILKIVDNIQLELKEVYIRYEHNLQGIEFTFGIFLKELLAQTCDENWDEKFNSDSKFCNKHIKITDFSVFFDHISGADGLDPDAKIDTRKRAGYRKGNTVGLSLPFRKGVSFDGMRNMSDVSRMDFISVKQDVIKDQERKDFFSYMPEMAGLEEDKIGKLENMINEWVFSERFEGIEHNYIIRPLTIDCKATICKDKKDHTYPLIHMDLLINNFKLNVYTGQIRLVTPFLEYFRLYKNFQAGVKNQMKERPLSLADKINYKTLYEQWIEYNTADKKKKAEKVELQMKAIENNSYVEEIIEIRREIINSINSQKMIDFKEKEIMKLSKKLDREKSLKKNQTKEKQEKSEKISKLLSNAKEEKKYWEGKQQDMNYETGETWTILSMVLTIEGWGIEYYNESQKMLETDCKTLSSVVSLANNNISIDFTMSKFDIINYYMASDYYPKIIDMERFEFFFALNPLKIELKSSDMYICLILPTLMKTFFGLKEALVGQNFGASGLIVKEKYSHLVKKGKSFIAQNVTKTGSSNKPLMISINTKAPVIIIPLDTHTKSTFLRLDFGDFRLASKICQENDIIYDNFDIEITNFSLHLVEEWKDLKLAGSNKKIYIIKPIKVALSLSKPRANALEGVEIKTKVDVSNVKFLIKPVTLSFFSNFIVLMKEIIPEKPKDKKKEIHAALISRVTNFLTNKFRAQKNPNPQRIEMNIKKFEMMIEEDEPFVKMEFKDILFEGIISEYKIAKYDIKVKTIRIFDMRKRTIFPKIATNPTLELVQNLRKDSYQMVLNIVRDPWKKLNDICLSMSDLRVYLGKDFLTELLKLGKYLKELKQFLRMIKPLTTNNRQERYYNDNDEYLRLSLHFQSVEIRVPADYSDEFSQMGNFTTTCTMIITRHAIIRSTFSDEKTLISKKNIKNTDELELILTHLMGEIKNSDHEAFSAKHLIQPSRVTIESKIEKDSLENLTINSLTLRIESICIFVGLRDITYLRILASTFSGFKDEIKKFTDEMDKLDEHISDKPKRKIMNLGIDADSIQITLLEDTSNSVASLFSCGMSNFSFQIAKCEPKTSIFGEFIWYVNYYNNILGCWEPLVEDMKLGMKVELDHEKKLVSLKTQDVLNVNFTHQFLVCVGKTLEKSRKTRSSWIEATHKKTKVFKHSDLEYVVYNKLKFPINVWLNIKENSKVHKVQESNTYSFFQHSIARLYTSANKKTKATLIINKIQIPASLAFSFSETKDKNNSVIIDKVSKSVLSGDFAGRSFKFLVNVFSAEGKRMIVFQSATLIGNNCDFDIKCRHSTGSIEIKAKTIVSVPVEWTYTGEVFHIIIDENAYNSNESTEIYVKKLYHVIIKPNRYITDNAEELLLIEISPKFHIVNLLHSGLNILNPDKSPLLLPLHGLIFLDPGKESILPVDPGSLYSFLITSLENSDEQPLSPLKHTASLKAVEKKSTETFTIPNSDVFVGIMGQNGANIRLSPSEKKYTLYKFYDQNYGEFELDLTDYKVANESDAKSILLTVSADYIVINKSRYCLQLENLDVPMNSIRYFSSKNKKFKLRMKDLDTKWSDKFRLNTIGVAGMVKVSMTEAFQKPQHILFGLVISQAPDPLINSSLISFTPRFLIWNLLSLPIFLKQNQIEGKVQDIVTVLPNTEDYKTPLEFNFNDYDKDKNIHISADMINWSGAFSLENIEDFQVKVHSQKTESEKKLNVFKTQWYMPSDKKPFRFIRVLISSSDEATIHIAFLSPKDPDFRIVNKTNEAIMYKQLGVIGDYHEINADSVEYWAWEDHLAKVKKLQLSLLQDSQIYSIEKIKEYQKRKLGPYEVSIEVNDVTRELIIQHPRDKVLEEMLLNEDEKNEYKEVIWKKSLSVPQKKISQNTTSDLFNKSENTSLNTISSIFKSVTSKLEVNIDFYGIGVSIFSKSNHELFYISMQGLQAELNLSTNIMRFQKQVNIKSYVVLKHFQIDSSDSNPNLFAVIMSPMKFSKENTKDDDAEGKTDPEVDFLMFGLDMFNISKKDPEGKFIPAMTKIESLELVMQKMQIKLNEEVIYKLMELKDYPKALKINPKNRKLLDMSPFSTKLPVLHYEKASVLTKIYFRFVKLGVLSISATFKQYLSNSKERLNSRFVLNLLKSFGGAFANITDSPFNFNEILVTDSFETRHNFAMLLAKNYIRQGIVQIYKVFGSIDILGNPLELVGKLGTGVYEFVTEPAKGLLGGPKSFAKGLGKGVKSLVSGVVGGSFESVSKISGGLYIVLKNATGDEIAQRPADEDSIGKNMLYGLKEGAVDVYEGFKGIVTKPLKGAKDKGTKGFFQGLLWGAAGLATSPIKLVLKVSNVISTSISSTTFLLTRQKIQKYGRVRYPRHIRVNKILEPYNSKLAQAQAFLYTLEDYRKETLIYFSEIPLQAGRIIKKDLAIILLLTPIYFLYILDGELYKSVEITGIRYLEMHYKDKIYYLCIATDKKNFIVPSQSYPALAGIYNVMASINKNLKTDEGFRFKRPKFIYKAINSDR
ncbi:hypothetical protein SteCoe_20226 [Stentor coeruleus]|uniref:Chorein N-terminal domain-containing protein n=1 Tax=Stentor coeruleus TaxID=5963 RepID=A0A1R2BSZ5_9CILI|nr:hypothetical protein SteCoe_20226 [Stentor coeruleus]